MSDQNKNVEIDELLKGLKRENATKTEQSKPAGPGASSLGELVTRADGSQAIKVKSRKRRSHQPKKEEERKSARKKVILISSAVMLVLLIGIAFSVMLGYYNGTKFNNSLLTTLENKSGASVEMKGLEVSLGGARMDSLNFDWEERNSVIDDLHLQGVTADYGVFSFFGGGWNGPEVLSQRGELRLNMFSNPGVLKTGEETPVDFEFTSYKCHQLDAVIGQDENWLVKGAEAVFSVNHKNESQIYLHGGIIKAPFFEEYEIRSGVVDVKQESADLSLVLQSKVGLGTINLSGEVGYKESSDIAMITKFSDVPMDDWINFKAKRFINGNITKGEGFFKMKLGDFNTKEIITHVESKSIRLSTFAFIETLSINMKDDYYTSPTFEDESKLSIHWLKDKIVVSDMALESLANLRVSGGFEIQNSGALSGKLKLGVPVDGMSASELRRLKKVFKEDTGTYIWTDVIIGGSVSTPTDNLESQFESVKEPITSPEDRFNQINQELGE